MEKRGFLDKESWDNLANDIKRRRCTPIIGPSITEHLIGSRKDIAKRWASKYGYPMNPHERERLPQVAQYLAVRMKRARLNDELIDYVCHELQEKYGEQLSKPQRDEEFGNAVLLNELMSIVRRAKEEEDEYEPHKVLASLDLPVYITANFSNLLADALKIDDKTPRIEICHWNQPNIETKSRETIFDRDPDYKPSTKQPLIYHLFGHVNESNTLVLTEDDYFDYLINTSKEVGLILDEVRSCLVNTSLLFLGFRLTDWDFRTLLRIITKQEGRALLENYSHVAVQIAPDESEFEDPEKARSYLEDSFKSVLPNIIIYWGDTREFITDLHNHLHPDSQPSVEGFVSQPPPAEPIDVFCSYAQTDENLLQQLMKHLSLLEQEGYIRIWHKGKIKPGAEKDQNIQHNINSARIILLLVSADLVASNAENAEITLAMQQHEAGDAKVIPVVLRSVDWTSASFGKLQALPKNGKPVTSSSWPNQDEAFKDITLGIKLAIRELTTKQS